MTIPENVKVLYKNYKVIEKENIHDVDSDLYGQVLYLSEEILINKDASDPIKEATLIHEIIHALDEMYCIGLKEKQVEKLGNAIYMVIEDNPQMFRGRKEEATCQ